jgi:uncharacterized cupredoxin-like copper-binding protein
VRATASTPPAALGGRIPALLRPLAVGLGLAAVVAGCAVGDAPPTPPITPGTDGTPREVNVVMKDYLFLPSVLDLAPGETVLFHFVNGGLAVHEAIIGDMPIQMAWEVAEAAHADPPPGPTPEVTVPAGMEGFRVVVASGETKDVRWTVPTEVSSPPVLGCHIPGHWAKGMQAPIRLVIAGRSPGFVTTTPRPAPTPSGPTPSGPTSSPPAPSASGPSIP